ALVMGRAGHGHRDRILQAQQAAVDDRAVGPGACAGDGQAVAARLDGVALRAVPGDPGGDVVHVPVEGLAGGDVAALLVVRVLGCGRGLGAHHDLPSVTGALYATRPW